MNVKTKKYQLDTKTYRRIALKNVRKSQWWLPLTIFGGFIVLNLLINLVYSNYWIYIFAPLGVGLYYLFWWVQFTGAPQLEQMKPMFQRLSYEISGKELLLKMSAREGMQIKWDMIKKAEKDKEGFTLYLSKAQFIHLPFRIFNSDNDVRFTEALLKRRKLLAETAEAAAS